MVLAVCWFWRIRTMNAANAILNPSKSLTVGALVLALGAGCSRQSPPPGPHELTPERQVAAQASPALASLGGVPIADVVDKTLPSVVSVSSTRTSTVMSPMHQFFGVPPTERKQQGLGSGVILSEKGIVVTNNHVVADAQEIKVITSDKREFDAKVLGTDPKSDLAVLQLEGDVKELQPVKFGDSSELRLGDVVLAIGNPFGVGQTVTMGIVSAKGRANMGIVDYEDFIQTDAAINPGNSGGALVNMRGELVGINTAILSRSGGYMGIGFAIPTDMARPIVNALEKDGQVKRGWLGVAIQDVDRDIQKAMKLPSTKGVLIGDVQLGTPAARGGLKRGDVVVKVDGKAAESTGRFRNMIAAAGSGTKVKLEVLRDGKSKSLTIKLGELPSDEKEATARAGGSSSGDLDGLSVAPLDDRMREKLDLGKGQSGVVITRINPGSPAAEAGLRPGDVILEVNRTKVDSVAELKKLYAGAKGNKLLLVQRGGATMFVVLRD